MYKIALGGIAPRVIAPGGIAQGDIALGGRAPRVIAPRGIALGGIALVALGKLGKLYNRG